jgi:hypothetical protein
MDTQYYLDKYESFVFEFDDVLYPEKDYLLQVYYMFAQFIEYAEQKDAPEILDFMKVTFAEEGKEGVFERTAQQFGIDEKYRVNFDLLMQNVKLPLKLLLFDELLEFISLVAKSGKQLFLLAQGDPVMALNKIRQTEWNGLEKNLKVYFSDETSDQSVVGTINEIIKTENLRAKNCVFFTRKQEGIEALGVDIIFLPFDKLFLP